MFWVFLGLGVLIANFYSSDPNKCSHADQDGPGNKGRSTFLKTAALPIIWPVIVCILLFIAKIYSMDMRVTEAVVVSREEM